MNWFEEFKKAYDDYPSQDNESYVPDRGGFKAGFASAWRIQEAQLAEKDALLDEARRVIEIAKRAGCHCEVYHSECDLAEALQKLGAREEK